MEKWPTENLPPLEGEPHIAEAMKIVDAVIAGLRTIENPDDRDTALALNGEANKFIATQMN